MCTDLPGRGGARIWLWPPLRARCVFESRREREAPFGPSKAGAYCDLSSSPRDVRRGAFTVCGKLRDGPTAGLFITAGPSLHYQLPQPAASVRRLAASGKRSLGMDMDRQSLSMTGDD